MARVPQQVTRTVTPSGRVAGAVIPQDIADIGTDVQGLAALGRGIGGLGQALLQIEEAEGTSQANAAEVQVASEMRLFQAELKLNNNTDTYDEELKQRIESFEDFRPKSSIGSKKFDNFIAASIPQWQSGVNILKLQKTQANIEAAYIADNAKAIALGDLDLADKLTSEALADGVITPQEAAKDLITNETEVAKLVKEDIENAVLGQAFIAWQATITKDDPDGDPTVSLKFIQNSNVPERDKGKLENVVMSRITNRQALKKQQLEAAQEEQLDNINKLMYTAKDYEATRLAIEGSVLSEREQGQLLRENDTRARLAAKGQLETNDPVAVDEVSTAINQVGNDTLPLEDAKKILNENRHLLKSEKVIEFQEELNKEFDRSTDTAYSRVRGDVRLRAIGKTESALDRLIEGLVGVKPKDQKNLEERITTARAKFNLELDNFNRWEDSMRAWRRTNNEASPEEIQKEGMRSWLTEHSELTPDQLKIRSGAAKAVASIKDIGKSKKKPPVRMQSPDGRTGTIPADQVEKAISKGWKKI